MTVRDVLPRDAIPSLDEPRFAGTHAGEPDDEVVVVDADPARAYPLRILGAHEIVNDVLPAGATDSSEDAGSLPGQSRRPIAVTWCPICWSAAVYDRRVDGHELTFGVSGKLADDALVMYDRETGSEWRQTSGEAIAGPLEGSWLSMLPAAVVTVEASAREHPDGEVLQPHRGPEDPAAALAAEYRIEPYEQYAEREAFGLYGMRGEGERRDWNRDDIDAKTLVLGIEIGDEATAYPKPVVDAAGGVLIDRVGDQAVVVFATEHGLYGYANPGYEFEAASGQTATANGATWDPVTGSSDDGRQLERLAARTLFAFAWQDVHGPDSFYGL